MFKIQNYLADDGVILVNMHRRLIREGILISIADNSQSYFFLFNDIMLETEQVYAEKFRFKHRINMKEVAVKDIPNTAQIKNSFEFLCNEIDNKRQDPPTVYRVHPQMSFEIDKMAWIADIELVINYFSKSVPSSGRKRASMSLMGPLQLPLSPKPSDKANAIFDANKSVFNIWKQREIDVIKKDELKIKKTNNK